MVHYRGKGFLVRRRGAWLFCILVIGLGEVLVADSSSTLRVACVSVLHVELRRAQDDH